MSGLREALQRLTPEQREALYRVAKSKARSFFADPKAMRLLRDRVETDNISKKNLQ